MRSFKNNSFVELQAWPFQTTVPRPHVTITFFLMWLLTWHSLYTHTINNDFLALLQCEVLLAPNKPFSVCLIFWLLILILFPSVDFGIILFNQFADHMILSDITGGVSWTGDLSCQCQNRCWTPLTRLLHSLQTWPPCTTVPGQTFAVAFPFSWLQNIHNYTQSQTILFTHTYKTLQRRKLLLSVVYCLMCQTMFLLSDYLGFWGFWLLILI